MTSEQTLLNSFQWFLIAAIVGGLSWPVLAQDTFPEFVRLETARSFRCNFVVGTIANWEKGKPFLEPSSSEMSFHFDSVDSRSNTARLIGNAGATDITAILTLEGLTFLERTSTGNFMLTTIFPVYQAGTNDFISVHSRHANVFGPVPSQYHGTCKVWE